MDSFSDKSVTVIVRDKVKRSYTKAYEKWLKTVHEKLTTFEGFLGVEVIPPDFSLAAGHLEYHIIFRFDQYENLRQWEQSNFLKERLDAASDFLHSKAKIQYLEGMELWFDLPDNKTTTQKPLYWKQVLVTIFTVYPLILGADWFLRLIFPMHLIKPQTAIFFTVVVVASLMVYPVMPFVTKQIGNWLYPK